MIAAAVYSTGTGTWHLKGTGRGEVLVTASREMKAAPAVVHGIIADYHHGHPRILPELAESRQTTAL